MNIKRATILTLLIASSALFVKGAYAATPVGTHDGLGTVSACSTKGWAYDPDTSSSSISVDIYRDGGAGSGVNIGRFTANASRPDVNSTKGITGNHGFDIDLTSSLSDGKSHSLYVYAIDSSGTGTNPLLSNSPKTITCAAPAPVTTVSTSAPSITLGNSFTLTWSSTNSATTCTSYHGTTGFGPSGSTSVTPTNSGIYTTGMQCTGPGGVGLMATKDVTVTAAPVNNTNNPPTGSFDTADNASCAVVGWTYDSDAPSSSISVDIYRDGGTVGGTKLGRFTANVSRSDVNSTYGITGNHGFNQNLSSYISDGATHSIYIYAIDSSGGTNPLLGNKFITCASSQTQPPPSSGGSGNPASATGSSYIEKTTSQNVTVNWAANNLSGLNYTVSCSVLAGATDLSCPSGWPITSSSASTSKSFQVSSTGNGSLIFTISVPGYPPVSAEVLIKPTVPQDENNDNNNNNNDNLNSEPTPPVGIPVITDFHAENGSAAVCQISASPTLIIAPKTTTTLTWSCDQVINSCALTDDNPKVPDIGAVTSNDSPRETPVVTDTTTFTLKCSGAPATSVTVKTSGVNIKEVNP